MADNQPKFLIDGNEYPIPSRDTFTMGEALVLEEYTGLGIDELEDGGLRPSMLAALMHISYQRANPDLTRKQVRAMVESANLITALTGGDEEETPTSPQTSDEPQTEENGNGDDSKPGSGDDSTNGSDTPVVALSRIGTQASAISAT